MCNMAAAQHTDHPLVWEEGPSQRGIITDIWRLLAAIMPLLPDRWVLCQPILQQQTNYQGRTKELPIVLSSTYSKQVGI